MPPTIATGKQAPVATPIEPSQSVEASIKKIPRVPNSVILVLVVVFGIGTGYVLSKKAAVANDALQITNDPGSKEVGIKNDKVFRDCTSGKVEENDPTDKKIEGSHKLVREGGPSQTLYMTSSVVALDSYIGKSVEVCGETLNSKKVPWFMEVGKLKLLE